MNIFGTGAQKDDITTTVEAKQRTGNTRLLYQLVRDFSQSVKPYEQAVRYQVRPNERFDITKLSQQVYGNTQETIAVMAAAGLDSVEYKLSDVLLTLPTPLQLQDMKSKAGF